MYYAQTSFDITVHDFQGLHIKPIEHLWVQHEMEEYKGDFESRFRITVQAAPSKSNIGNLVALAGSLLLGRSTAVRDWIVVYL